jgi:hypothetical protein
VVTVLLVGFLVLDVVVDLVEVLVVNLVLVLTEVVDLDVDVAGFGETLGEGFG